MTLAIRYIYIRTNPSYDVHDACKMGKSQNIHDKDLQYTSRDVKRGCFETVFEVPIKQNTIIERLLQYKFRELNINRGGGVDFYNKKIITLIEPYLITLGIKYKKLSKQEISDLTKCD